MDHLLRRFALVAVALLGVLCASWSPPALATYGTQAQAQAACENFDAWLQYYVSQDRLPGECRGPYYVSGNDWKYDGWLTSKTTGQLHYRESFYYTITAAQCSAQPVHHFYGSGLDATTTGCHSGCTYTFTPDAQQVVVRLAGVSSGGSGLAGNLAPTGATCSTESGVDPDTYTPPPQSKLCGGGSCYDPLAGKYCAVTSSGAQVCVDASAATASGGCGSASDGALCAGSPPPRPPNPPIVDPATDIQSSDAYQQLTTYAAGVLGSGEPVTVNAYGAGGAPTSSGSTAGDSEPAPPSSTAGPGSLSGGQDCNSPPICSGDVVMCGVVFQQWQGMCRLHKDLTSGSSSAGPDIPSSDLWTDGTTTGNATADAANQGNYDQSGMGFSTTCPLHDLEVPLPGDRSFAVPFSKGCDLGAWLRAIIIGFALFSAAKITAGGNG